MRVLFAALLLGVVGWDFVFATTFLGDDYLFLAFASHQANPLAAFVRDLHGGEYFRPVPMLVWWLLGRLGHGAEWPFAVSAFLLHAGAALLVVRLALHLGVARATAWLAGALFLIAPTQREAALWFSANTDLLATVAVLGSLVCLLSGMRVASAGLALVAYLCKETALVLPLLAALVLRTRAPERPRVWLGRLLPHAVLALLYLGWRTLVLHGLGGTNDLLAPWWARGLQIGAGLLHVLSGPEPIPEILALLLGLTLLSGAVGFAGRQPLGRMALLWVLLAVVPLPAAGWVVGARYFYLPAVGLVLLLALAIQTRGPAAVAVLFVLWAGLGLAASESRADQIGRYRATLSAARQAVATQAAAGTRVFLVRGAVKDLDLALKLTGRISPDVLVIPDVPASFVWIPEDLATSASFLLARPPLPPDGAYRFGGARIVGLARREEAPDLDDVLARLPGLRIIDVRPRGR